MANPLTDWPLATVREFQRLVADGNGDDRLR